MKKLILTMFSAVLVAGCASTPRNEGSIDPSPGEKHTVRRVLSGDTLELEDGRAIRLAGITAPAPGEPFFEEARRRADQFLVGRGIVAEVRFVEGVRDGEGRPCARVSVMAQSLQAGVLVNTELLEAGFARIDYRTMPPGFEMFYEEREVRARKAGSGIWSRPR